jgi:pathogenesis-related protein 1
MQHSRGQLGENLYWASARKTGGKSIPQPITEKEVVAGWATEKPWYSRATNTCEAPLGKTCGHYTQIVWEATREVGCAKAICKDSSQIWVCNYAPAGNMIGQRPY